MLAACNRSEQWLRQTIRAWAKPAPRHASTTSAIKRGLRATKTARDGNASRARDGHARSVRDSGVNNALNGNVDDSARRARLAGQRTRAGGTSWSKNTERVAGSGQDRRQHSRAKQRSTTMRDPLRDDGRQNDRMPLRTQQRHDPAQQDKAPRARQTSFESKPFDRSGRGLPHKKATDEDDVPISVPYSTAASEFLYGYNPVIAALQAQSRKFYHLYLHPRSMARDVNVGVLRRLVKQLNIRTTDNANVRLLDKLSEDRPHNGVILEASRLPAPPLLSLASPDLRTSIVPLVLDRQNAEDLAINGAPAALPTLTKTWRHPFVLMLDGIVDPANVGNILRTAHFYGVNAVVISTNTSAPLTSAVLAKASSGACEALRLFSLPQPSNFVHDSAKAGWQIYAAVAPQSDPSAESRRRVVTTSFVAQDSPLAKRPVILMLGAEGEGLRENLTRRADRLVSIEQGQRATDGDNKGDVGVDSLNVSTAAGVLIEAFMRKPQGAKVLSHVGDLGF